RKTHGFRQWYGFGSAGILPAFQAGWKPALPDQTRPVPGFHLWAFVIMPEHVHVLIYPGETPGRMADILYTLKKSVANRAITYLTAHAPAFLPQMMDRQPNGPTAVRFWQRGGGYDENLYRPRKIWEKVEYIHANPVRRGL